MDDKTLQAQPEYVSTRQLFREKPFVLLLILGLLLRLSFSLFFPTYPETDFMWYHTKAAEIADGKGFLNGVYPDYSGNPDHPTAFRPIGYPATLAALYFITGPHILAGKLLNVAFSTLTLILLYVISRRYLHQKLSLWILALFALSPLGILYPGILGSESLFGALLLLTAYFTLCRRNPYWLGLCVGYLALVRPIGIYFLSVLVLFFFLDKKLTLRRKLIQSAVTIGIAMLLLSPWLLRNYMVFGTPVYSTNGGYVIYVNNNPYATGSWSDPFKYPNSPFLKYKHETWFDELGMHQEGQALALQWIKENPADFFRMGLQRMLNSYWSKLDDAMWAFTIDVNSWHPFVTKAVKLEETLYRPFYLLFGAAILFTIYKIYRKQASEFDIFILLNFLYFNAMLFVLEGNSRYLFPLHPYYGVIIVTFAAYLASFFRQPELKKGIRRKAFKNKKKAA